MARGEAVRTAPAVLHEAVGEAGAERHQDIRLWLRLLACTNLIKSELRRRLRAEFATTLARFDMMAQLQRCPGGLKMSQLSHRLMVTGGNVTAIADQLEKDGLAARAADARDRRAVTIALTPAGHAQFERMARAHERWVIELCASLDHAEKDLVYQALGKLKGRLPGSGAVRKGTL